MKTFSHLDAKTVAEASAAVASGKATLIAGGTDLLGHLKNNMLRTPPELVVNLKTIPNLAYIKEEGGMLKIGAGTHLADIATSEVVSKNYAALAQAAGRAASPHIREMGTIGGNLCQLHRCWYFRLAENRFDCVRKGGKTCFAMAGDHRYHSIFGADKTGCIAVHPSDTAPALIALDAKIVTNKRTIPVGDFFEVKVPQSTVLAADEIVTEIQVPTPAAGSKSAFLKFALRKSIDFPIVNCAVAVNGNVTRIALNGVAPKPYRATKAEEALTGKAIDETTAEAAAAALEKAAVPLPQTKYKVQIARTMVKRALLSLVQKG